MKIQNILYEKGKITLSLLIHPEIAHTGLIPDFSVRLLEALPKLTEHHCINDENVSFREELDSTELAHAFEHILMELICEQDPDIRQVAAWTSWDWKSFGRNTFQVEIDYSNRAIFAKCLREALHILNQITHYPLVHEASFAFADKS